MIKGIIFDYGGVLSPPGTFAPICEYLAPKYKVSPDKLHKIFKKNWMKARIDEIPPQEFWKNLAKFAKTTPKTIKTDFLNFPDFNYELLDWIKILKKKYKIGMLSNHIKGWLGDEIKNKKLNQIFDVIITSYDAKIAKPNPQIFRLAVKKIKLKPEECIYVDDLEKNIHPSIELGMNTIHYKNNQQLKKELLKLEVKVEK